jgi:flagellar hook-associated protein 1
MTTIFDGFDSIRQALSAQQFALSITQKNVANANNPTYTRQVAVFSPGSPDEMLSGVPSVSIQASRNGYIDYGISHELQLLGENSAMADALQQVDAIFSGNGGQGLQQSLSEFFNSFSSLAGAPENLTLRQQVLSKAQALTAEFHRVYNGMQRVLVSQNSTMTDTVNEINSVTQKIAELNKSVSAAKGAKSDDEFTLRDTRQALIEELSSLVDISYYETESGAITVTTKQGGLLVLEDQSHPLGLVPVAGGVNLNIQLDGTDITSAMESGRLGGLVMAQERIAGYLNNLDDMAAQIIARVNEQHAQGIDLSGVGGGAFFAPFTQLTAGSNNGAARSMSVVLADPREIAAAGAATGVGNNDNAKLLAAIQDEKLFTSSTQTASQFFAGLIYGIGSDEKAAADNVTTQNDVLIQLKNQRDSSSGVNLDEEALNIVKYQKAYQASAKFASVLESLSDEILNIMGV